MGRLAVRLLGAALALALLAAAQQQAGLSSAHAMAVLPQEQGTAGPAVQQQAGQGAAQGAAVLQQASGAAGTAAQPGQPAGAEGGQLRRLKAAASRSVGAARPVNADLTGADHGDALQPAEAGSSAAAVTEGRQPAQKQSRHRPLRPGPAKDSTNLAKALQRNATAAATARKHAAVAALLELKALVAADGSGALASWRGGRDPCRAYARVQCDAAGYVTSLDLSSADDLALRHPDVRRSNGKPYPFTGLTLRALPCGRAFLAGLPRLGALRLDNSRVLDGRLPACWVGLAALRELQLSAAGLAGPLPPEWARLARLEVLDLSDNPGLSGTLPGEWAALKRLRTVDLSMTLPSATGGVSGRLPPTWGRLASLEVVDLWQARVSGPLPPAWGRLARLRVLHLGGTLVSGTLPPEWRALTKLEALFLADTQVQGALPGGWGGGLAALRYLEANGTRLVPPLPRAWNAFCRRRVNDTLVVLPWRAEGGDAALLWSGHGNHPDNLCSTLESHWVVLACAAAAAAACGACAWLLRSRLAPRLRRARSSGLLLASRSHSSQL